MFFLNLFLILQDYGEVEPNFVEEFEDELNYEWEIIKANGSSNFIILMEILFVRC
jgi:hypothetical protein